MKTFTFIYLGDAGDLGLERKNDKVKAYDLEQAIDIFCNRYFYEKPYHWDEPQIVNEITIEVGDEETGIGLCYEISW